MITILKTYKEINEVLGIQSYDDYEKYRLSSYLFVLEVDDGFLVQNILTRELILFTKTEYNSFINMSMTTEKERDLVYRWFYVPENISDRSIYYLFYQQYIKIHQKARMGSKNLFTIFTTTSCNARCPYCYEKDLERLSMSNETALDVAKYIDENRTIHSPITLKWFGGEPLVNGNAINIICDYLQSVGAKYVSSITSNGYLFDKYTDDEIINLWKLKSVQITLDGTRDVYNSVKNYISDSNEAFDKVILNIERLLSIGVKVAIRLNVSHKNGEDLLLLLDYLRDRFSSQSNFSVYSHVLFDGEGDSSCRMNFDERNTANMYYAKIQEKTVEYGFGIYGNKFPPVHTSHCMADNNQSICITPTGNLTLCEHHVTDEIVGNIYEGITNLSIVKNWSKKYYESKCDSCRFLPQCITLKKCVSFVNGCDEFNVLRKEISARVSMKNAYNNYLKNLNNENRNR